ncbi:hypothetical protein [Marinobacterium rhizophilum]|uniref:hypothetical protein n=1 Tax=Marinobacterium rhizophilum TaxID=420402 RepID=UPI0003602A0C|nr:hypothetical protein [Marinobacterium rhizophilum]
MDTSLVYQPIAGILALLLLALCWPIAQALRHERLRPLAAYLLFVSVLALTVALSFRLLLWVAVLLLPPDRLESVGAAIVLGILSLMLGLAAACWVVRRPQRRRMPR